MCSNSKAALVAIPVMLLLASCGTVPPAESRPGDYGQGPDGTDARVEVGMFYDSLAPYGQWFWDDDHGWCWSPSNVSADWRPYTDGWWAYTDVGWCWQSDLAWGWAPFHYGRWAYRPARGWIWLPDTVWAPAWVAWRCDDDWVGWAPLPPQVGWRAGIGLQAGAFDLNVGIEPSWWSFCAPRQLVDRNLRRRIVPVARNVTLVQRTRNVTHLVDMGRVVADRGFDVERVDRANRRPIQRFRVADLDRAPSKAPKPRGEHIQVYRPQPMVIGRADRTGRTERRVAPPQAPPDRGTRRDLHRERTSAPAQTPPAGSAAPQRGRTWKQRPAHPVVHPPAPPRPQDARRATPARHWGRKHHDTESRDASGSRDHSSSP